MSTSHERINGNAFQEPARQPYTSPLLTRYGTVEELTQITTDQLNTGSGIPTDVTTGG